MIKPIKVLEVKDYGWYLVFRTGDFGKTTTGSNFLGPYHPARFYEYDKDGVWRSDTGHGVTIEDPDYFDQSDYAVGPIENIKKG